jgi:formate dehydrogenase subunit gamma
MIERYSFHERICHWLTGVVYCYCLATGLAFYSPWWFWIAVALGGGPVSRFWHPFVGIAFVGSVTWMHAVWRSDMGITGNDREWLRNAGDYATNRDDQVPAQDRFNAGQKSFYWAMFYGALLLVISGLVMWLPEYLPAGLRWVRGIAILLHESAALITIGAFIIHVYMGVFMVPGSVAAITKGRVSEGWARAHHRLWLARVMRGDL